MVPGGDDFVGFAFAKPLPTGTAKLHVEWKGNLSRKEDRGLFAQNEGGRWYAITQFEAIFARRVFPCFDEPSIKVPWQLTLEVPRALVALSNTSIVDEKPGRAGMKTVHFAETAPLPSYLIAFAVGPYDLVRAGTAGEKKIPMRVAAPFGRGKDAGYAAKNAPVFVDLLEKYFGIPFPYGKLDSVAIPITSTFGAMENAGMVTFALGLLVAKPTAQSLDFERDFSSTAAHEFAHQWFGDLVTTAWWNDIWLNESFASWMEDKIIDEWKPEWTHHTGYVEARAEAMGADILTTTREVRQPIVTNNDIYNMFDAITYQKGESVLAMFERFVGPDKFRAGIRHYLIQHANGNATADDFIAAIAGAAQRPEVAPAFKSFLDQPGAPLADVTLACAAGKPPALHVKQERFLPVGSKGSPNQTWHIPMCVRWLGADGKPERTCALVTQKEQTLTLGTRPACPTWLLANDGEVGYYRASYPTKLLREPAQRRRAQAARSARDGRAARRSARARRRRPHGARRSAGDGADAVDRSAAQRAGVRARRCSSGCAITSSAPRKRRATSARIEKIYGDKARALGWTPKPGEDEDTRLLRPALVGLVAAEGDDKPLIGEAHALALKWLADRKAVSPDVADAVLGVAARYGDRALFDKMHAAARHATDRHDRREILSAMGEFRDPALARAALQLVAGNEFDARESTSIVFTMARDPATRQLAWDFLKANFDALLKRTSTELMAAYGPHSAPASATTRTWPTCRRSSRIARPSCRAVRAILAQAVERGELCRAPTWPSRSRASTPSSKY